MIFSKTIVQKVMYENSPTIIIKSCDSADKLFAHQILIKQLVNCHKYVKILGQELTGAAVGGAASGSLVNSRWVGSGYCRWNFQ